MPASDVPDSDGQDTQEHCLGELRSSKADTATRKEGGVMGSTEQEDFLVQESRKGTLNKLMPAGFMGVLNPLSKKQQICGPELLEPGLPEEA